MSRSQKADAVPGAGFGHRDADALIATQLAALPWRIMDAQIEVLLVTSRTNSRWMLPKGWPMEGLKHSEAAAREAFEEAGVLGEPTARPLGSYRYIKLLKDDVSTRPSQALIYGLKVTRELKSWSEKSERKRQWFTARKAAKTVYEPDLARFLRAVARGAVVLF